MFKEQDVQGSREKKVLIASLKSAICTSLLTQPLNIVKTRLLLNTQKYVKFKYIL
jgi:hypothetical protein